MMMFKGKKKKNFQGTTQSLNEKEKNLGLIVMNAARKRKKKHKFEKKGQIMGR